MSFGRYTPLFSGIVESSLWDESDSVVKVFLTMLALKDADHVVRCTPYAIGRKCWPRDPEAEKKVMEALEVLQEPDRKRSEPQEHDGRRIKKVDDGWLILNGPKYQQMMREANRRIYARDWMAKHRAEERELSVAEVGNCVPGPSKPSRYPRRTKAEQKAARELEAGERAGADKRENDPAWMQPEAQAGGEG